MHKSRNNSCRRKSKKVKKSRHRSRSKPMRLSHKLKEQQFYCVSCNKVCVGDNVCVKTLKNGAPALYGKCAKCNDCKVYKFIKCSAKKRLTKKYGKC